MSAALRRRIARVARRQYDIDDEHERESARAETDALLAGHSWILDDWAKRWEQDCCGGGEAK